MQVGLGSSADAGCPWVGVTKRSICQRLLTKSSQQSQAGRRAAAFGWTRTTRRACPVTS
jgi:hypothetical protein